MRLRDYLTLGVIVGTLPNNIANGAAIDAIPVMADFNWIVSQVNANAAPSSLVGTVSSLQAQVNALGGLSTWTPSVNFNGGTTGLSYAANGQLGFYTTLGSFVFFMAMLNVVKGSSGGVLFIDGLPVLSGARTINAATRGYPVSIYVDANNPSSLGIIVPYGIIPPGSTRIEAWGTTNGNFAQLNQSDFGLNLQMWIMGLYPTA